MVNNGLLKSYKRRVWDLLEYFQAFDIQSIPRTENKHVDKLATIGAQYNISKHVEDEQIINFLQSKARFSERNQSRLQRQYADQVLHLSSNKLPRGLVTLDGMFNSDDQSKGKCSNLATSKDDYVPAIVVEGKTLSL